MPETGWADGRLNYSGGYLKCDLDGLRIVLYSGESVVLQLFMNLVFPVQLLC